MHLCSEKIFAFQRNRDNIFILMWSLKIFVKLLIIFILFQFLSSIHFFSHRCTIFDHLFKLLFVRTRVYFSRVKQVMKSTALICMREWKEKDISFPRKFTDKWFSFKSVIIVITIMKWIKAKCTASQESFASITVVYSKALKILRTSSHLKMSKVIHL